MENAVLKRDKWATVKKNALFIIVGILAVMTIVSFALFGKLTRDYFVFDSNRESAKKELVGYAKRIKELELALQIKIADVEKEKLQKTSEIDTLEQQIAKREAVIGDQQNRYEESTKLEALVKRNRNVLNELLEDIQNNRLILTVEQGKVITAKDEISILSKQRESFKAEVNRLIAQIDNLEQQEKIAEKNTINSRKEYTTASNELQITYSKTDDAKKKKDDIDKLYDKQKELLNELNAKLAVARGELEAKETAIGDANKRVVAIKAEMSSNSSQLGILQNEVNSLDKRKKDLLGEVVSIETNKK